MSVTITHPSYDRTYTLYAWRDNNVRLVFTQGEGITNLGDEDTEIEVDNVKIAKFQLRDEHGLIDLTDYSDESVVFALTRPDESEDILACKIETAESGIIYCPITASATAIAGDAKAEIRVSTANGVIKFSGIHAFIYKGVSDDAAAQSTQFSALVSALQKVAIITGEGEEEGTVTVQMDEAIVENGTNPVASGVIYDALVNYYATISDTVIEYLDEHGVIDVSGIELKRNRTEDFAYDTQTGNIDNEHYPTTKAIKDNLYFTPEMFGAKGDGTTNDLAAIRTMFDNVPNNALCVFYNNYKIESIDNIDFDGITISKPVNVEMYGTIIVHNKLNFGVRVSGHDVRRNKFRLNLKASSYQLQWGSTKYTVASDITDNNNITVNQPIEDSSDYSYHIGKKLIVGEIETEITGCIKEQVNNKWVYKLVVEDNVSCAKNDLVIVKDDTRYYTIGLDLYDTWENEFDISLVNFNTGVRLISYTDDCTYNKIFIRNIYDCKTAILLTGQDYLITEQKSANNSGSIILSKRTSADRVQTVMVNDVEIPSTDYTVDGTGTKLTVSGVTEDTLISVSYYSSISTTSQNTFIGGRIGANGSLYLRLDNNDDTDCYYPLKSELVGTRTNNNNNFFGVSFECGFGVKASPYANRAKIKARFLYGSFIGCRYEGITGFEAQDFCTVIAGYAFDSIPNKSGIYNSYGNNDCYIGTNSQPIKIKRSGNFQTNNNIVEFKNPNNYTLGIIDKNGDLFFRGINLTPNKNTLNNANDFVYLRGVKGTNLNVDKSSVSNGEWGFSYYRGYIVNKPNTGNETFVIQPIYTSEPDAANSILGMSMFDGVRPKWWNGTSWVYANGDTSFVIPDITGKADKATTLSGYGITDSYTKTEVDNKLASVYKYKGSVATYQNLPSSGLTEGDVYNVESDGSNYAWTGSAWDKLGGTIDLSGYQTLIDSSHKLSSDLVDDTNKTNKFVTASEKTTWNGKYEKPSNGIPLTDLSSAVQTSLGKADSAVQPNNVYTKAELSTKTLTITDGGTTTNYDILVVNNL